MRKITALLTAVAVGLTLQCQAESWAVKYGSDKNSVSVYNYNTAKNFAEDASYGPMSFRIEKNKLRLLDSVAGKLMIYGNRGKLRGTVKVPNLNDFKLLEDFVFTKDKKSFWVANAEDRMIRKIDLKGRQLALIDDVSLPGGKIAQVNQLEIDSKDNLYVGDCGLNRLNVFNKDGKFIRDFRWQNSGFALDEYDRLHMIDYTPNAGYFHKIYEKDGHLASSEFIGLGENTNPRLWAVKNGNLYISFIPKGGFRGVIKLFEIGENACILRCQDIVPQGIMNRYIEITDKAEVFIPVANFDTAPKGVFAVKPTNGWQQYKYPAAFSTDLKIKKEPLVKLPADISENGLLGMRVEKDKALILNKSGKYITCNLTTGETFTGFQKTEDGILDFDIKSDQMVYIDPKGHLGGKILPFWPKRSYTATRIEACDEGVILTGGSKAVFLSKNIQGFKPYEIENFNFAQPIPRGFVWTVQIREDGKWGADLTDCFGQRMGKIYTFNENYNPVSIEVGPSGPESELLVSNYESGQRKIMLIGNNGRMFWKLDAPDKLCPRDMAFDNKGLPLFLERMGSEIWLVRWQMTAPEG